jgi:hypothetical protein
MNNKQINGVFRKTFIYFIMLSIFVGSLCSNALATEGGGGAYPNGAEGFLAGAMPPPGLYYVNYLAHYASDRLNDKNGDKIPIDFHARVSANASRILYMSDKEFLGGQLGAYGILSLIHMSADTSMGAKTKSGLGDITAGPVLAWHFNKNLHAATALDITAPTGAYNKNDIVNLGRNYWTFEPKAAVTYLGDNGIEVTTEFMYDFNTENTATKYTSGQEFHIDYATGYQIGSWKLGAEGYFYKQVTNDHGAGAAANDGNKGQVFAVGPAVKYDFKTGGFIELKYAKEMLVENRPEGDKFLCKLVIPF